MKKHGIGLIFLLLTMQAAVFFGQTPERPAPWFKLSIEEVQLPRGYPPSVHELLLTYTNSPNATQKDPCVNTPWVYQMVVLRDGVPVEKRKKKTESTSEDTGETSGRVRIHSEYTEANECRGATHGIPPGATIKFPLWPSAYYDMSIPGTYTITVKRETFPFDPAKSVTVWSNTITVVVPPAGNPPPAQ
jgi:hypothetical protein